MVPLTSTAMPFCVPEGFKNGVCNHNTDTVNKATVVDDEWSVNVTTDDGYDIGLVQTRLSSAMRHQLFRHPLSLQMEVGVCVCSASAEDLDDGPPTAVEWTATAM